jgi:hypothetical protein
MDDLERQLEHLADRRAELVDPPSPKTITSTPRSAANINHTDPHIAPQYPNTEPPSSEQPFGRRGRALALVAAALISIGLVGGIVALSNNSADEDGSTGADSGTPETAPEIEPNPTSRTRPTEPTGPTSIDELGFTELAPRQEPCVVRAEPSFTADEFPQVSPPDDATTPVPGAVLSERSQAAGFDWRTQTNAVILESGWATPQEGVPSLLRAMPDNTGAGDPIMVLEQCPTDGVFATTGNYAVMALANPTGLLVVDLEDASVVGATDQPIQMRATAHPSRPPGVWVQRGDMELPEPGLHFLNAETMQLSEPLDALANIAEYRWLIDTEHGLVVETDEALLLVDPFTGEVIAQRDFAPDQLGNQQEFFFGGDDETVWLSTPRSLHQLDTATLTEVQAIATANLWRPAYGVPNLWYSTLDEETGQVTLNTVDSRSGETELRASFVTSTTVSRSGTAAFWEPVLSPQPDGSATFFDSRAGATFRLDP